MINKYAPFLTRFAAAGPCKVSGGSVLGFPHWYAYLPTTYDANTPHNCIPAVTSLSDVWLVVAAVIEILLRIAAIAAIVMLVYGGIQFIISNGNPDQAKKGQATILNAIIGLVIAVGAATIIQFLAGRFTG